jgi:hypothetical protein
VNEMRAYLLEVVPSPRADAAWAAAASLPRLRNQVARIVRLGSSARRAFRHLERRPPATSLANIPSRQWPT